MKKLIEITNNNSRRIRISYDLGNTCNFKCWYCFPGANEGDKPFPNLEVVKHNLVRLINFYFESKMIDEVQVTFLGGEPSLWRDLGELVEFASKNVTGFTSFQMLTNGSRTLRWWEDYGKYFDHISISVHHEKGDVEHIEKVANVLTKQGVSVLAAVLMDHTAWDRCLENVNYLIKTKTKFMVLAKPININGVVSYNEEQQEYLRVAVKRRPSFWTFLKHINKYSKIPVVKAIYNNGEKVRVKTDHHFIMNLTNRFKGWSCSLGINYLFISREGEIKGTCNQKVYGLDFYHNINDPDFISKFNPILQNVICEQNMCLCAGETIINKKIIPIKHEN